jgi:hypothetical protein
MAYPVEVFNDLTNKFTTWEAFQEYLTSPEGGSIRCVGEGRYRILRYVKGVSDLKTPHGKWMRSVIWDTQDHLPVCVAPPKAEKGDLVTGEKVSYPLIQDFLDGTMIQVFRTFTEPNVLQVATRTQIGAQGKFYSNKTFEQLFDEALTAMGMTRQSLLDLLATPTEMVPNHFASLVLQHPEHRVVARCRSPRLWVVHVGAVLDNATVNINENPTHWPIRLRLPSSTATRFASDAALTNYFNDLCQQNGWFYQGLTFKDGKGKRWRLRNPNYIYLRTLRGSEATPLERFLRLRSESKVSEYLKHYTEERNVFWDLEQTLRQKTREVYDSYCKVHKSHEAKLDSLEWAIKPCVFKLHSHYLEHLRPNNEKVLLKHAVELVNNLPLFEQKRLLTSPSIAAIPPPPAAAAGAAAPVSAS